ncbi:MAG: hypothetical protein QXD53_06955 [Candidatus Bathyarchaeia archaeon]
MSRRLETIKLTASFKLDGFVLDELFQAYRQILSGLLDCACDRGVSSFKRLKSEKYCDLRGGTRACLHTTFILHAGWHAQYTNPSGS